MKLNLRKLFPVRSPNLYLSIIVILLLVCIFMMRNYYLDEKQKKDGFTTRIREMYRPYFRNIRLFTDRKYIEMKNNFFSFIRKIGLN
jgi:hypothetical protein